MYSGQKDENMGNSVSDSLMTLLCDFVVVCFTDR